MTSSYPNSKETPVHSLKHWSIYTWACIFLLLDLLTSLTVTEISSIFILQGSHQLSSCEPSLIRYHVRGFCSSKPHFEENFHTPRRGHWFWVMHDPDRGKSGMGRSSFLICHSGSYCCWTLLHCNVSSWQQRKTYQAKSQGKFSVFISHVIKTKNRNRSINKFKNLGYDRWLQCKQPR